MADKCGFAWAAPLIRPGGRTAWVRQVCVLDKGHEDDHRSSSKVTAPNYKES